MVDYDKLPIRCRVCLRWKHKASDCKMLQKKSMRGKERLVHTHHTKHPEKGKNIEVDQDGFQQVKSRKSIRRNTFEHGNIGVSVLDPDGRWMREGKRGDPTIATGAATTVAAKNTTDNNMRNSRDPRGDSNTKTRTTGGVGVAWHPGHHK